MNKARYNRRWHVAVNRFILDYVARHGFVAETRLQSAFRQTCRAGGPSPSPQYVRRAILKLVRTGYLDRATARLNDPGLGNFFCTPGLKPNPLHMLAVKYPGLGVLIRHHRGEAYTPEEIAHVAGQTNMRVMRAHLQRLKTAGYAHPAKLEHRGHSLEITLWRLGPDPLNEFPKPEVILKRKKPYVPRAK